MKKNQCYCYVDVLLVLKLNNCCDGSFEVCFVIILSQ